MIYMILQKSLKTTKIVCHKQWHEEKTKLTYNFVISKNTISITISKNSHYLKSQIQFSYYLKL
jgi:hypothetical protein